jgi:hypothetical protein
LRKYIHGRRNYKAEGSFADAANNHGFKRARWRGLAGIVIQNLMIAAIQNLRKLMRSLGNRSVAEAANLAVSTDIDAVLASKMLLEDIFATICERILTFLKSVADKIRSLPTFQNYILFKPRWATRPSATSHQNLSRSASTTLHLELLILNFLRGSPEFPHLSHFSNSSHFSHLSPTRTAVVIPQPPNVGGDPCGRPKAPRFIRGVIPPAESSDSEARQGIRRTLAA